MNLMKTTLTLIPLLFASLIGLAQKFEVPASFSHLKQIDIVPLEQVYAFVKDEVNPDVPYQQSFETDNPFDWVVGMVTVDAARNKQYLLTFTMHPSNDYRFCFYQLKNTSYVYRFAMSAKQIYIPSNGFAYISGHTNNMFNKKRKLKFTQDTVIDPELFIRLA